MDLKPYNKNLIFYAVSAAVFLDMMTYSLVIPVLPSYSIGLGASEMMIGVIYGAFSLGLLVFSIPFGILSDRVGRREFMICGMLSLAAADLIFILSNNFYLLIAARIVQGMSGAATWSAGLALIADTFDASERGGKLGFSIAIMSVGTLFGPVAGGIIYDNLGYAYTFLIPAAIACIIGIVFMAIPMRKMSPSMQTKGIMGPIRKAPALFVAISAITIISAATYGILEPYLPVYFSEKFSATATVIGLAFGAMSLVNMIASIMAGRLFDRYGGKILIPAGLLSSAVVIVACTMMPSMISTAAVFSLLGITFSFVLTPLLPLISNLYGGDASNNTQGFIYGIYNTLFSVGLALGPFLGGVMVTNYSLSATLTGQAVLLAAIGLLSLGFASRFSQRRTGA